MCHGVDDRLEVQTTMKVKRMLGRDSYTKNDRRVGELEEE